MPQTGLLSKIIEIVPSLCTSGIIFYSCNFVNLFVLNVYIISSFPDGTEGSLRHPEILTSMHWPDADLLRLAWWLLHLPSGQRSKVFKVHLGFVAMLLLRTACYKSGYFFCNCSYIRLRSFCAKCKSSSTCWQNASGLWSWDLCLLSRSLLPLKIKIVGKNVTAAHGTNSSQWNLAFIKQSFMTDNFLILDLFWHLQSPNKDEQSLCGQTKRVLTNMSANQLTDL